MAVLLSILLCLQQILQSSFLTLFYPKLDTLPTLTIFFLRTVSFLLVFPQACLSPFFILFPLLHFTNRLFRGRISDRAKPNVTRLVQASRQDIVYRTITAQASVGYGSSFSLLR